MIQKSVIRFKSEGVSCEADLYLPSQYDPADRTAAVVLGHGFTVARSSLVEEGRLFAEAGYVALAIDYRHFGTSGGSPRGRLWPLQCTEDFKSAIDWLELQPGIDPARIGIWGTSFGGGVVTHVAAHDIRVKACVAQAPIMDGGYWIRSLNRESEYLAIRQYLLEARRRRAQQGGDPNAAHGHSCRRRFHPHADRSGDDRRRV